LRHIRHGIIDLRGREFAQRLRELHEQFSTLLASILPGLGGIEVAVERAFMHRNADSALKLAQARGALLAAIPASYAIFEYAPRAVKQATVGSGAAGKSQVGHMAGRLLGQSLRLPADAADALAVAICHANSRRLQGLLDRGAA
jgi:crossover junction endodeoxyribonuclease RuvC